MYELPPQHRAYLPVYNSSRLPIVPFLRPGLECGAKHIYERHQQRVCIFLVQPPEQPTVLTTDTIGLLSL